MNNMNEQQAQKHIHQAVQDSLSWLDGLPSQENDILERVKKEDSPLITVYNAKNNAYSNPYASAPSQNRISRFRPILAFSAVIVLIAALWAIRGSVHTDTPIDRVTQPLSSQITPGTSGSAALPAAVTTPDSNDSQVAPLDRIDLYVEPDLLWNKETGILADGDKVVKEPGRLPFQNTTYRKMKDAGTKVDGELVYRSSSGTRSGWASPVISPWICPRKASGSMLQTVPLISRCLMTGQLPLILPFCCGIQETTACGHGCRTVSSTASLTDIQIPVC